jgi:hypothetical protein
MGNPRAGTSKLRLSGNLAVLDHEGEIGFAICQVTRNMLVIAPGRDLPETENFLVALRRLLLIRHLQCNVDDTRSVALAFFCSGRRPQSRPGCRRGHETSGRPRLGNWFRRKRSSKLGKPVSQRFRDGLPTVGAY